MFEESSLEEGRGVSGTKGGKWEKEGAEESCRYGGKGRVGEFKSNAKYYASLDICLIISRIK